jgi:hypothetical protein
LTADIIFLLFNLKRLISHGGNERKSMLKEHGSFEIQVKGRVIEVKVSGSWNADTAQRYCSEYSNLAAPLVNEPWAELVNLTEWELDTPEAEKILHDLSQWADKNNLKYEAMITGKSSIREFQLDRIKNHPRKIIVKYFKTTDEAVNWLRSHGFELT